MPAKILALRLYLADVTSISAKRICVFDSFKFLITALLTHTRNTTLRNDLRYWRTANSQGRRYH